MSVDVDVDVVVRGVVYAAVVVDVAVAVGSFTPLVLRKLDIDPAVATGPFVTTSIDMLGVLFYFVIAGLLLNK